MLTMGWLVIVAVSVVLLLLVLFWLVPRKIVDITKTGSWAVVTGATDGIGKSFSHELARKGLNIVLVSRNSQKLDACAKEIKERFKVQTKIIQADFTSLNEDMYANIRESLRDMDIGVLVNNVGMASKHPDMFHVTDEKHNEDFQNIINCNITSAVNMTRFVIGGMVERKRGLIINISSVYSVLPSPWVSIYGSSKAFLTKFSIDMNYEYRKYGVHVHLLVTGFVSTKLSQVDSVRGWVPTPETYVKSALRSVERNAVSDGYIGHTLVRWLGSSLWCCIPWIVVPVTEKLVWIGRDKRIADCSVCNGPENIV